MGAEKVSNQETPEAKGVKLPQARELTNAGEDWLEMASLSAAADREASAVLGEGLDDAAPASRVDREAVRERPLGTAEDGRAEQERQAAEAFVESGASGMALQIDPAQLAYLIRGIGDMGQTALITAMEIDSSMVYHQ